MLPRRKCYLNIWRAVSGVSPVTAEALLLLLDVWSWNMVLLESWKAIYAYDDSPTPNPDPSDVRVIGVFCDIAICHWRDKSSIAVII